MCFVSSNCHLCVRVRVRPCPLPEVVLALPEKKLIKSSKNKLITNVKQNYVRIPMNKCMLYIPDACIYIVRNPRSTLAE